MNVNIQTVHFDADEKLVEFVNRKLAKLPTFHDKILKVDVFLKLDNVVHNIKDKVEIILEMGQIILKPIETPRKNWDVSFEKMHQEGDDTLLITDVFEDEDFEEWK